MIEDLAARLAPEIDRIALCVHRPAGQRPELRRVVEQLELPTGTILAAAARALSVGRVTLQDLELLSRYESRSVVALNLQRHVDRGFLSDDGAGDLSPSVAFRTAAQLVLRIQGEVASDLWAPRAGEVEELAGVARRFVESAVGSALVPTPAFDGQGALHHVVPSTPPAELLGRITELRYLRADVHSVALGRHSLAGPRARALARAGGGHAISDRDGAALEKRGLLTRSPYGWAITDAGDSIRAEVERDTNSLFVDVLGGVDGAAWKALLAGLLELAGEDPRPVEDR